MCVSRQVFPNAPSDMLRVMGNCPTHLKGTKLKKAVLEQGFLTCGP